MKRRGTMNWVEKRQDCNARDALGRLYVEAKEGVETRCRQLEDSGKPNPTCVKITNSTGFTVARNGETVTFKLLDLRTIRVDVAMWAGSFDVRVEMGGDQQCVMMVDDERLESWQVLYKALDRLLF